MNNREIDALIAEKIMGWKVVNKEYSVINKGDFPEEFKPTEYIEDAFFVVNKFEYFKLTKEGQWYCEVYKDGYYFGDHEIITLAICDTALNAYGIDLFKN